MRQFYTCQVGKGNGRCSFCGLRRFKRRPSTLLIAVIIPFRAICADRPLDLLPIQMVGASSRTFSVLSRRAAVSRRAPSHSANSRAGRAAQLPPEAAARRTGAGGARRPLRPGSRRHQGCPDSGRCRCRAPRRRSQQFVGPPRRRRYCVDSGSRCVGARTSGGAEQRT